MASLLGIFGGTFDPVHRCHISMGQALCTAGIVDRLHYVVTATPVHRPQPGASGQDRLAMLRGALEQSPALIADDRELRRTGPSYTIDTLRDFRAQWGPDTPLALLLGEDVLQGLRGWRDWQLFAGLVHCIVLPRPHTPSKPADTGLLEMQDAAALRRVPAGYLWRASLQPCPVSASQVRARLGADQSIVDLVPEAVASYIAARGLYGTASGRSAH